MVCARVRAPGCDHCPAAHLVLPAWRVQAVSGESSQLWRLARTLAVAYVLRVACLNLPYFWLKRWSVVAWRQHLNNVLVRRFLDSGLYLVPVAVDGSSTAKHSDADQSVPRGIANPAARIRDDVESFLRRWSMVLSAKLFNVLGSLPSLWVVYSTFGGWAVAFTFALVTTVWRVTNALMADAVENEKGRSTATGELARLRRRLEVSSAYPCACQSRSDVAGRGSTCCRQF